MNPYVRPRASADPGRSVGDINDLLATVSERWRPKVYDTQFGGHVFLKKLMERGRVNEQGGEQIVIDLEVSDLKAGGLFAPYSKLDIRPNQILTTVAYPWCGDYQIVSFSTQETSLSMGNPRVVSLVTSRYKNAQKSISARMEGYFLGATLEELFGTYSNGGVFAGVDQADASMSADATARRLTPNTEAAIEAMRWNSLDKIIDADTPQGGLAADAGGTEGGWYARTMYAGNTAAAESASNTANALRPAIAARTSAPALTRRDLDYMYMLCTRGGMSPPHMGLTDYEGYLDLKDFLWDKRQVHSAGDYELGFGGVMLNSMPVSYTENRYLNRFSGLTETTGAGDADRIGDSGFKASAVRDEFTLYYLNFDHLEVITKSGHWQKRFGPSDVPDRPAVYHRFESLGNLTVNNRRYLGKVVRVGPGAYTRAEAFGPSNQTSRAIKSENS